MILSYNKGQKPVDRGFAKDFAPLPPDGDYLAVVQSIGEPFERKSGGFSIVVNLGIVGTDQEIPLWIECLHDGTFTSSWKGIGKWNSLCEALNIKEGDYQSDSFAGCPLNIKVVTTGKYKNVGKMWACSEGESHKAADWWVAKSMR